MNEWLLILLGIFALKLFKKGVYFERPSAKVVKVLRRLSK
jgi:hypothetical protein